MLLITRTSVVTNLSWFLVININCYFICLFVSPLCARCLLASSPGATLCSWKGRGDETGWQREDKLCWRPKLICLKTWFYDRFIICMPLKLYFRYYRLLCKLFIHTYFSYYKSNSKLLLEKSQTIKIIFLSFHSLSSIPVLELTVFIQFQYFEIFCDICTTIHTYTHRLAHIPTCFLNVSMVIRLFSQFIHLIILTAI